MKFARKFGVVDQCVLAVSVIAVLYAISQNLPRIKTALGFSQTVPFDNAGYTGSTLNLTERVCDSTIHTAQTCFDAACPRQFPPSLRERVKQVLSLRNSLPEKYMPAVRSAAQSVTKHKYIFVTGSSSNHYQELQIVLYTMFENFLPRFQGEDYALVVYDLGLTSEERNLTERNCRCTLLDFPFHATGISTNHNSLRCFVWRKLLVAALLEKAEYVMWFDASIRFRQSDPFPEAFLRARDYGFQSRLSHDSIACRASPLLAQAYGDELCQYSAFYEMQGNLLIVHNDRLTWELVMKPLLTCAVTKNCQCVDDRRMSQYCRQRGTIEGQGHRTQSAFGMLLSKLYQEKRPMLHIEGVHSARRRHAPPEPNMDWFKLH